MGLDAFKKLKEMASAKKPAALPIGVEFGTAGLKILQVERPKPSDPLSLTAAAYLPTPYKLLHEPTARLDFQLDAMGRLIRAGGFRGGRVVCSIPSQLLFCKHVQIQKAEGVSTGVLVQAAIAQALSCEPGQVVTRHTEVGAAGEGKTEVIATAVPRTAVERMVETFRSSKLELAGVHAEHAALIRALDCLHQRVENSGQTTLYIDIGYSGTHVMIARGNQPMFVRFIEFGGRRLDEAVAQQLQCELEEAREKRFSAQKAPAEVAVGAPAGSGGAPNGVQLNEDLRVAQAGPAGPEDVDLSEALEILTDEVRMCVRYYDSLVPNQRIERTVFVGGESLHRGLCQHLARAMRVPASIADPLARVVRTGKEPSAGVDLTEAQPGWAVALGLCLSPTEL